MVSSSKHDLRKEFLTNLRQMQNIDVEIFSDKIFLKIVEFLKNHPFYDKVAIYYPINNEPNLLSLINIFPHINWLFPKIIDSQLKFNFKGNFIQHATYSRIKESDSLNFDQPQVIIIPGLAFNKIGYRLGYGKGYYDKFIANLKTSSPFLIGVCYDWQIIDIEFNESHDIRMDLILTN